MGGNKELRKDQFFLLKIPWNFAENLYRSVFQEMRMFESIDSIFYPLNSILLIVRGY